MFIFYKFHIILLQVKFIFNHYLFFFYSSYFVSCIIFHYSNQINYSNRIDEPILLELIWFKDDTCSSVDIGWIDQPEQQLKLLLWLTNPSLYQAFASIETKKRCSSAPFLSFYTVWVIDSASGIYNIVTQIYRRSDDKNLSLRGGVSYDEHICNKNTFVVDRLNVYLH